MSDVSAAVSLLSVMSVSLLQSVSSMAHHTPMTTGHCCQWRLVVAELARPSIAVISQPQNHRTPMAEAARSAGAATAW